MKDRWPLTDEERARLEPVIDETDVPVCVSTAYVMDDEAALWRFGMVTGRSPFSRRIVLIEECFERASDDQLRGILARAIAHHRGRHRLLRTGLRICIHLFVVAVALAVYWVLARRLGLTGIVVMGLVAGVGAVSLWGIEFLVVAAFSRWGERDALRRGVGVIGSTAPLEALYEPRADAPERAWWGDLFRPYPHPSEQLAQLAALRDDADE